MVQNRALLLIEEDEVIEAEKVIEVEGAEGVIDQDEVIE